MLKKISALIIFILFILGVSHAQTYEDVVYLKNGSIIRGLIIEQVPNKSIKIQTADRNVFVYQFEEIDKITKEEIIIKTNKSKGDKSYIEKGKLNRIEIGLEPGIGYNVYLDGGENGYVNKSFSISFHYAWVYLVNPYFSVGGFTGLDFNRKFKSIKLPIGVDMNAFLLKSQVSPYLFFKPAYYVGFSNDDGPSLIHGFYINTGIGIRTYVAMRKSLLFNVGYSFNTNTWHNGPDFRADDDAYSLQSISIRFGFIF